jgi:DNA-binding protein WhiA
MSFSQEVKEELVKHDNKARHCQIAELSALLIYSQSIKSLDGASHIEFDTDNLLVIKRCKVISDELSMDEKKILQMIKYTENDTRVKDIVIKSICCKRAFLRGAFISVGSMSNPEKGYHLEFVCIDIKQAFQIVDTLIVFDINAKVIERKKYYVVYIKESEEIVELLNVIGAHVSLMNLENLRILKDMRNSINRRVNCEAANITKTVNAATKQIDDIEYIRKHYGFENLDENLREMASERLAYPEATLKELGQSLGIGKSGVNHRLRKLSLLADRIREERQEKE